MMLPHRRGARSRRRNLPFLLTALFMSDVVPRTAGAFAEPATSISPHKKPWCQSEMDYSAANEFIAAHYGRELHGRKTYFAQNRRNELVYDARQGVYDDSSGTLKPPSLDYCGFQLLDHPLSDEVDWKDLDSIRQLYLPNLRKTLKRVYGEDTVSDVIFWCPTVRTAHSSQTDRGDTNTPRSGFVATAHIDTDVNAYESAEQLLQVVWRNRIQGEEHAILEELVQAVNDGRRFAIVNAWRNIGRQSVTQAPLAVHVTRYATANAAFPHAIPDHGRSRWYTCPSMTPDELLLFCQYDRDVSMPSDLWHCAILIDDMQEGGSPRESFDVRCFILFHDHVPSDKDRFGRRERSLLSLRQSAKFCSEQAARRLQNQNITR